MGGLETKSPYLISALLSAVLEPLLSAVPCVTPVLVIQCNSFMGGLNAGTPNELGTSLCRQGFSKPETCPKSPIMARLAGGGT